MILAQSVYQFGPAHQSSPWARHWVPNWPHDLKTKSVSIWTGLLAQFTDMSLLAQLVR